MTESRFSTELSSQVLDAGRFLDSFYHTPAVTPPSPQDASSSRDEEFVNNVNALMQDAEAELSWSTATTTEPVASTSTQPA